MSAPCCRWCRSADGEVVLDLGDQPACEYFPPLHEPVVERLFRLRLWLCGACGLAQLPDDAPDMQDQPEGLEPTALADQRRDAVAAAYAAGLLPEGATVIEGATPHGGSWWPELSARGLRRAAPREPADVVVDGTFGMMHAVDQSDAFAALVEQMAPEGVFLFQFHSLAAIVSERQWNAVRLGHYAYYSLPALEGMLARHGLIVTRAWRYPLYGGTVLVAAQRAGTPHPSVAEVVAQETSEGVLVPAALRTLQDSVDSSIASLRALVEVARGRGDRVYGYGAASRAVALLYLAGLQNNQLLGVADASTGKQGCRMPGTTVPIIAPADLTVGRPDVVLVFVSDIIPEVRRALPQVEKSGGRWVDAGGGVARPCGVAHPSGQDPI